jgi:hypothetical protein
MQNAMRVALRSRILILLKGCHCVDRGTIIRGLEIASLDAEPTRFESIFVATPVFAKQTLCTDPIAKIQCREMPSR